MFTTSWTGRSLVSSTRITMTHGQYFHIRALSGYVQQRHTLAVETSQITPSHGWLQLGAAEGDCLPGLMASQPQVHIKQKSRCRIYDHCCTISPTLIHWRRYLFAKETLATLTIQMDLGHQETQAPTRSYSTASTSSDGSNSTVIASPTSSNNQPSARHRGFLSPHQDRNPATGALPDSPTNIFELYPNSPASTNTTDATLNSPSWEHSTKLGTWRYGLSGRLDDGDDQRRLLKSPSGDDSSHGMKGASGKYGQSFQFSTASDIHKPRSPWLTIVLPILSVFSTVLSGLVLILALKKHAWGTLISTRGTIPPSMVPLIFPLLAKIIELSFSSVFVAFLGQALSRRVFDRDQSKGMTITEMSMRTWVVQPTSMIAKFRNLGHIILSRLGALTLIAALLAMFYTTASDVLGMVLSTSLCPVNTLYSLASSEEID